MDHYAKLESHFGDITTLKQIDSLLDWDRSVMMPERGIDQRARQVAVLNVKIHDMQTDPRVGDWLAGVNENALGDWQRANLRVMRDHYRQATAVGAELIERKMLQETKTEMVWRRARAENDFALVLPELEKLFAIVREYAQARAAALDVPDYDALMVHYVPGMSSADVDVIFDELAGFLPDFTQRAIDRQQSPLPLPAPFDRGRQQAAGRKLADLLGFTQDWSRLDVSAHPFSSGIGGDVRITARYSDNDFINALQAVAHEAGHGFYDHNTPAEWSGQPVGISGNMGMAIHESQSLGVEMQMGRSRAYWDFLAPHLRDVFGGEGAAWSGENLYRHATRVSRGFIRFEADEITYPAHVILRYRLEKQLVEGKLALRDLPEAWNAQMKELVGVVPPTDTLGCLQDIHWHMGAVGYFPAYALGAVIAAQFTAQLRKEVPDLDARVLRGDFEAYIGWMRDKVHRQACLYRPAELIERVTGEKLTARHLRAHLQARYLEEGA